MFSMECVYYWGVEIRGVWDQKPPNNEILGGWCWNEGKIFFSLPFGTLFLKCCRPVTADRMLAIMENCHSGLLFACSRAGTGKQLPLWWGPWKAGSWRLWLQDCCPLPCLLYVSLGPIPRTGGSRGFCMCVHACFHKRKRGVVSCIRVNGNCEGEVRENGKL